MTELSTEKFNREYEEMLESLSGGQRLHQWFGLTYASWLTLPRVVMCEMPDEWQLKMAKLLEEMNETFSDPFGLMPEITVRARDRNSGKLVKMPEFLCQYRYPDYKMIDKLKRPEQTEGE